MHLTKFMRPELNKLWKRILNPLFARARLCKAVWLATGILLLAPSLGEAQRGFNDFVERVGKRGDAILYSECSVESGKDFLILFLKPEAYDVWLFEVEHGWLLEGTHVVIKRNEFEFIDPPGGEYTRARIRRYVEELLRGPFMFLGPSEVDKLRLSMPKGKCPSFGPEDINRQVPTEKK